MPAKIKSVITQSNIEKMEFYMPYYGGLVQEYKRQGVWKR